MSICESRFITNQKRCLKSKKVHHSSIISAKLEKYFNKAGLGGGQPSGMGSQPSPLGQQSMGMGMGGGAGGHGGGFGGGPGGGPITLNHLGHLGHQTNHLGQMNNMMQPPQF